MSRNKLDLAELVSAGGSQGCRFLNPYIIAEAGVNHEGDLQTAIKLIHEAAEGGAHAIKFQTYKAEALASVNSPAYWDKRSEPTESQFLLFKKYDGFEKREYEQLKYQCDQAHIEFLSTPFDLESAKFLDALMPVFKISSSDITNKPLIDGIAGFGKPIVLSTGASDLEEIRQAVQWIGAHDVPVALLHCVLNYPTDDSDANLGMIMGLEREFPGHVIGYSDHTLPNDMELLERSAFLGAEIIEKHFTHDKSLKGNDHYHAMDIDDLRRFVDRLSSARRVFGQTKKEPLQSESIARRNARRSIVATRRLDPGERLSVGDLTWKRPGGGVSPADFDKVIGAKVVKTIREDELLNWDSIDLA